MTNETWKPIEGWPYEVSDWGNVRRSDTGQVLGLKVLVSIDLHDGSRHKTCAVHRLVADAFLVKPSDDHGEVNHRDGDRTNNRTDNLEWITRIGNIRHAHATGLAKTRIGQNCPWAILTEEQVREMVRLHEAGATQIALSKHFNVGYGTIHAIIYGRNWKHITEGLRRGRRVTGSAHHLSKLTEADIPRIRQLRSEGMSMRAIGRQYGVSNQTIRQIFTGKSWKL